MKRTKNSLSWLLAAVITLAGVAGANAESAKQRTGKVVRIKGAARYSTGGNVWQPLKVGTILHSGTIVQTASDSFADVVLNEEKTARASSSIAAATASAGNPPPVTMGYRPVAEQDLVRIWDDTVLAFDRLNATETGADKITETELDLRSGRIFGSVKKQSAASRFEIKIPNGVAGIRGTIFFISADGLCGSSAGSIIIAFTKSGGDTGTQTVVAGFQFNITTGEMVPIPSSMLPVLTEWIQQQSRFDSRPKHTFVCDDTIRPVTRTKPESDDED